MHIAMASRRSVRGQLLADLLRTTLFWRIIACFDHWNSRKSRDGSRAGPWIWLDHKWLTHGEKEKVNARCFVISFSLVAFQMSSECGAANADAATLSELGQAAIMREEVTAEEQARAKPLADFSLIATIIKLACLTHGPLNMGIDP
jgi:hypothetical protein